MANLWPEYVEVTRDGTCAEVKLPEGSRNVLALEWVTECVPRRDHGSGGLWRILMECYWVLGQRLDFLATGETTGGHYSLFHLFIPAGPPGPLPHTHRDADEFFFVVEGRVEILFEDAWRPLGPGQFLHVPRGTIHTFRNVTTDAARMLSGFVPSGIERFFRDFGHSARLEDVEPLPVQEAEIQRLNATANQYGMDLFG
jgi:mannose-6-phosphate isomerase-like protein (cupin superfamily)